MLYQGKQKEYEYLKIKVPKSKIGQIKSISELQNKEFDDVVRDIIDLGISFKQNSFLLQDREHKIRVLDNMLLQIYPFLYKTYQNEGINVPIQDKICTFYLDITPCFVQRYIYSCTKHPVMIGQNIQEVILTEAYRVFDYVKNNFPDEFKNIESTIFRTPRSKTVKALFSSNPLRKKNIACENHTITNNDKFKDGYVSTGKYKKDDGTFGATSIEFPPIPYNSEQYEQTDEEYISSGKLRKNPKL